MDNEFYASLKLVSGEEVFSLVSVEENTDNPLVLLQNPVTMKIVNTPDGVVTSKDQRIPGGQGGLPLGETTSRQGGRY